MTQSTIDLETIPVRDAHRFDEAALAAYMRDRVDGFAGPLEVRQFAGGESNPTFLLRDGRRDYVLRKKPPGKLLPSAHAVDREYRVMTALADTDVPVPKTYGLCEDDGVIGTAFFLMEKVEGRVLRDPLLSELASNEERAAYYEDFMRVLAALHRVDVDAHGLGDYGRKGGYIERQIARWTKQYVAAQTEDIPEMDRLIEWLPKNLPADDSVAIAHGDYRPENTITRADAPKIAAVVDWELSTIGHPLCDLAYCCMGYYGQGGGGQPAFHGQDLKALGLPEEQEMIDMYCRFSDRDGIDDWYFYIAFSLFRAASIVQGVYKRGLDGNASSSRALEFKEVCRIRSEVAWGLVEAHG